MQDTIVMGGGGSFEKIDARPSLTGYLQNCTFFKGSVYE